MTEIIYKPLTPTYFKQVIELANQVHGDGYVNDNSITDWVGRGITKGINCSFVALKGDKLLGFRCTFSATRWLIDQWCSPALWPIPPDKCCYFKCNTVDRRYRGMGVGKQLLQLSIDAVKKQGALGGVAHLWRQSPNNSAVAYFTHCGGKLVKNHPDKWHQASKQGYSCILCGYDCHCEAAEMIIHFDK
ncbi:MAG: GNAT family N-acetyltransferase [Litorilituus sp.]|jgi:GNAT superfamily N-acetyltransferase|nr:GNAT family N-acetyltransferase [Litorilituus sp.]